MVIKKGFLLFIFGVLFMTLIYALGFSDTTQNDFNNGTYVNTTHNGTTVILSGNNLTGTFTSRVFDASSVARWDNLSSYNLTPSLDSLYAVDANADFWRSTDGGVNWEVVKDDYNNGDANGATDLEKNLTYLFLLFNQDLWVSSNFGVNWTKINDDYNGAEGQNGDVLGIDNSNYVYIIEGDQDVWRSTNGGISFFKLASNFNGGNGVVAGLTVNSSGAIFVVDVAADVWVSLDQGTSWSLVKDDFNGAIGNSADDLAIDSSNNLYILDRQDFWKSIDNGVSWTLANTDINGAGDSNNGFVSYVDQDNNIYVVDGNEDVIKSNDSGATFVKVNSTDFNAGNGNVFGLNSFVMYSNLTFQVQNCSTSNCSDGAWQTLDLNNINLTGRYFQYRTNFSTQEAGLTPSLINTSIGYIILDNTPSQFSNYIENPTNDSAYVYGQTYKFNVTITESNPGTVWIEFNGINYTDSNITNVSNVYMFNRTNLAAGTYTYRWWANDSFGNLNLSETRNYIIEKGNSSLGMNITGTISVTYGTASDFNGVETNNGDNGCVYSMDRENQIYGAGTWTFNYSTLGCANYSSGSVIKQLTVGKASPLMNISGNSSMVYGTITDINATETNNGDNDLSYLLYRNGVLIGGSLDNSILAAGNYTYMYTTSGGQNYSSRVVIFDLIVSKKNSTTSLVFDKVSPQPYGITINASCYDDNPEETLKLYRNNSDVTSENNQNIVLPMGIYDYTCNVSESQNYSSASSSGIFVIEKAVGEVKLYLNGLEDNLTIWSIQESNITATTLYGNLEIYLNGVNITNENGVNQTRSAGYYNVTAISLGDENHSSEIMTRWLNITEDTTPPSLSIISPTDGNVYGYSQNISLDFSVSDKNLQICWYNLDNWVNITIINCQNTNFNVSGTGNYTLNLYANDSYGNENNLNINFSVQIDAPTITLSSPRNVYLNHTEVIFTYTPGDVDLGACELWGDFDGMFKLNQIDVSPINYSENIFNLNLSDGTYTWNVKCNDTNGHSAFDGNKVFYVDTTTPSISLIEPIGTKTSRTGIPIQFSIIDASQTTCWYNVKYTTGQEVLGNTTINCSSASFGVSTDGDYVLNFYVNDSAGNSNTSSSSFSVSTSVPPVINNGGSSGRFSSGSSGISPLKSSLSVDNLSSLAVDEGGVKKILTWKVKNDGKSFLNDCKFNSLGKYSSWISHTEAKGLAAGEEYNVVFDVTIPENIGMGSYEMEVSFICGETNKSSKFNVEVLGKQLEFKMINAERSGKDNVKIDYSIQDIVGKDQNVDVQFLLFDMDNKKVAEVKESKLISANTEKEFQTMIPINEGLLGELSLLINLNSETYSGFVQENIVLGSPVSGFAIFDNTIGRNTFISTFLVILFLVFAFFVIRRIKGHRKVIRHEHIRSKYALQ